jgi:hypothetical protein
MYRFRDREMGERIIQKIKGLDKARASGDVG